MQTSRAGSKRSGICFRTALSARRSSNRSPERITFSSKRKCATGHAHEDRNSSSINKTSYIENCETSAIGRALGALGIGSDEFISSAEELNNALEAQEVIKQTDKLIDTIIDMADGDRERVNTYVGNLFPGNKLEDLDYSTLVRLKANIAKKIAAQPKPETAVPVYNIERRS